MFTQIVNRVVDQLRQSVKDGRQYDGHKKRFKSVQLTTQERYYMRHYREQFVAELQALFPDHCITFHKRSVSLN